MKSGVKITYDGTKKVYKAITALALEQVYFGIPQAKGPRKNDDDSPITNAEIGYINEFGSPERNIPARPHLIPGIRGNKETLVGYMKVVGVAALKGDFQARERALNAAGLSGQNAVRRMITTGPFIPLSPVTIAIRACRGRTGTKPLMDTGQYRAAITYVIGKQTGPGVIG